MKVSAAYTQSHIIEDLHPAFVDSGLSYDERSDSFAADIDDVYDEAALFDSQRAFTKALETFQQGVQSKYKSKVDLEAHHDWNEVMAYANDARAEYLGAGQRGIMKKINHRLKTFQTAAPAIEAWLKLLPSTSIYGSAAVHLRQLRKETIDALDQMPLCIEKAQFFMRTYGYTQVNQQVGDLYLAIIDALQHILEWYKRAAGSKVAYAIHDDMCLYSPLPVKYLSAFSKGAAFAEMLKNKMKKVELASQAMNERASQGEQSRLKEIRKVTSHTNDQVGELKILAVEARNHLYAVLKDTEAWQEALQSWKESRLAREHRRASRDQDVPEQEEINRTARKSLLACFGFDLVDPSRDEENMLNQITSMTLGDQDRVGAIVDHQCSLDDQAGLEIRDAGKLLKLFQKLLRRSSGDTPVVLVLDGISFYEDHHRRDIMGSVVRELTSLANSSPRCLIVLMTCPIRSSYVAHEPKMSRGLRIAEIPEHIGGAKQGLDSRQLMSLTEMRARKLSESLGSIQKSS
ncbi:MAG: hypothetical protein L6R40_001537 [Gallowayella cf. fulva]|nr:MAG: hypothetical protein L6R40_001537 [Xanthomendoza cf. fulva]